MTAFLEQIDVEAEYLLERGKPMPSKNHSRLESRLARILGNNYEDKYETFVELSLELSSGKATPDLCMFLPEPSDWLEAKYTRFD
jgi:Uma2 family endonuclease